MKTTETSTLIEKYERLVEISCDLSSTLDLNKLLNRIVHAAADLSNAQAASILLYDEKNKQFFFQAASNMDSPVMKGLVVPYDSSIAGVIASERKPIIISDTQRDPRHFKKIAKPTGVLTRSLLGVPLLTKDKVVGVLEAINKSEGDFTEEDKKLLLALGAQAAIAIENTRLFQQTDLISELVHELRTPLASLSTASHLLSRPEINEIQRVQLIHSIQNETNRLSEMASSFLDMARLESGRMPFLHDSFNVKDMLEESLEVMRYKADEKKHTLELKVLPNLPELIADRNKIKQVVINLVSNAIKYTPNGGKIIVSADQIENEYIIYIKDNGLGIPEDALPHIFEKFYRVPLLERVATGTGLGLSICKKIIETHGGNIEIQSKVNEGTSMIIHLPYKQPRGN
ncbi:MAG: GAF domain-containing sensor histidine kinase [Anaerolineales bacterium]|nr:GAF domain-containing sensor histidine kinase [Anaerolineales bacterium]